MAIIVTVVPAATADATDKPKNNSLFLCAKLSSVYMRQNSICNKTQLLFQFDYPVGFT